MNRKEQIIFGTLGLIVAVFGCIAAWLALDGLFPPPPTADPPTQAPPVTIIADPPTQLPSLRIMDNIYNSLRLENLVADKANYTSGEVVWFSYKATNFSGERLVVPENNNYSPALYLVGIVQTWV